MERRRRTLLKMITFRFIATITMMALVFIFTNNLLLTGTIGLIDMTSKSIIYYIHERLWNKISWGSGHSKK